MLITKQQILNTQSTNMHFVKKCSLLIISACYLFITANISVFHILYDETLNEINVKLTCNVPVLDPFDPSIRPYIRQRLLTPLCEKHTDWLVIYNDGYLIWKNVCWVFFKFKV